MAKHFSIPALRTPWIWKGKKVGHWKMNSHIGAQYATGEEWINNSRKNEETSQSENNTQLWMWLVMQAKSDAVKNNIT